MKVRRLIAIVTTPFFGSIIVTLLGSLVFYASNSWLNKTTRGILR
jgi:hypothetical protein